jgi:hypothetical protein
LMPRFKPTIPLASGGLADIVEIRDEDWSRIENVLGFGVPLEIRSSVHAAMKELLAGESLANSAEPLEFSLDRIRQIKKCAIGMHRALLPTGTLADLYARHLVKEAFRNRGKDDNDALRRIGQQAVALARSCDIALRRAERYRNAGSDRNEAWNYWIRRLTKTFKEAKLPIAARKDSSKRPSPFVVLISELQKFFPEPSRRSTQSLNALAQAIAEARKSIVREQ